MESGKGMNVISMRRFLACIGVSCVLGAISGFAGGLMNWSDGVAFAVLLVAGTITAMVTLHENLFQGLRPPRGMRRRSRRHA
jgi:fatty acid desaturase